MNSRRRYYWLVAGLLFVAALLPRIFGLQRFLTSDEKTNIFIAGSDVIAAFLAGNLRETYWHFYPGVTMSWLDALGMGGQYLLGLAAGQNLPPFTDYIYSDILALVAANRLPYALLTALAVPAIYLLARRLLPDRVALLGALFIAFDPFFLAHSRVAHGDAPVAVFMSLSALCFFIYAQQHRYPPPSNATTEPKKSITTYTLIRSPFRDPYLIASAILGSLAALTKAPGQFMALFVIGASIIYTIIDLKISQQNGTIRNTKHETRNTKYEIRNTPYPLRPILPWLTVITAWGLISLLTFIILWPSMWVDPLGTFSQMWAETFGKVNEGHLVYFFGQPTLDPGPWFYLYVIPFRLTPVVLIGSLLSLFLFVPQIKVYLSNQPGEQQRYRPTLQTLAFLWLFTLSLLLFGNLSPKKQDRYLLPLFPFLNLIAAIGWLGSLNLIYHFLKKTHSSTTTYSPFTIIIFILLALHVLPTLTYYPYYLTYFNPLMGGPTRAAETTLMGWGEGMEQAAAYLNNKPNAERLYVASTPAQTLLPYFAGTGENFYTNDIAFRADYVVLYLAQRQRLAPSPEIVRYFDAQEPEKVITIQQVPYAKIYPGPKLILADIPAEAVPVNIGLDGVMRLAGYHLSIPEAAHGGEVSNNPEVTTLDLTLYWHALAPIAKNYTISVRAQADDGAVLAQQDQAPVNGLLPTHQWRQGDYIADTHSLTVPAPPARISRFEIVVYNSDTGQTLGPPVMIDAGS